MSYKRWSLSYTRNFILTLIFVVTILVMMLFMITAGLRCVDKDGCIREHCATPTHYKRLIAQYKPLLK